LKNIVAGSWFIKQVSHFLARVRLKKESIFSRPDPVASLPNATPPSLKTPPVATFPYAPPPSLKTSAWRRPRPRCPAAAAAPRSNASMPPPADVALDVAGVNFAAHLSVLHARAPAMMQHHGNTTKVSNDGKLLVSIDDIPPASFEALLHFAYTDSLPIAGACSHIETKTYPSQHIVVQHSLT
jgi:hypothetical protein